MLIKLKKRNQVLYEDNLKHLPASLWNTNYPSHWQRLNAHALRCQL